VSVEFTVKPICQRLIVVLGMHRSGTSTVTRALQAMGVELGSRLMPAVEGVNDTGFWEDLDLNELNIEMLGALNREWHSLAPVGEAFVELLCGKGFLSRAEELLRLKIGQSPVFGFKDPRVTVLLPFWQRVFALCDIDVSYVLALRNPVSVAKSLARREHFEFRKSTLLWLGHVLSMMRCTMGAKRRILVDYDRLVQAPGSELQRVAGRLNLVLDPAELQKYEREFLNAELQHSIHDTQDLSVGDFAMPLVIELYPLLQSAASDTLDIDAPVLTRQVNDARVEFARHEYYLSQMDVMYQQSHLASQEVSDLNAQISALQRAIEEAREQTREAIRTAREREAPESAIATPNDPCTSGEDIRPAPEAAEDSTALTPHPEILEPSFVTAADRAETNFTLSKEACSLDIFRPGVIASIQPDVVLEFFDSLPSWSEWFLRNRWVSGHQRIQEAATYAKQHGIASVFLGLVQNADISVVETGNRRTVLAKQLWNRQRGMLDLIAALTATADQQTVRIFGAEALSTWALAMRGRYPRYVGSEYLPGPIGGKFLFPIVHQDLRYLAYPDTSFDVVASQDVLEHVPDLPRCLTEMQRVLRPGGVMLSTFPFLYFSQDSHIKARLVEGQIEHLVADPEFHVSPLGPEGALVFQLPGWDMIEMAKYCGFADARFIFYYTKVGGIFGEDIAGYWFFVAQR
jgi:SAM-dependent methyltransferase